MIDFKNLAQINALLNLTSDDYVVSHLFQTPNRVNDFDNLTLLMGVLNHIELPIHFLALAVGALHSNVGNHLIAIPPGLMLWLGIGDIDPGLGWHKTVIGISLQYYENKTTAKYQPLFFVNITNTTTRDTLQTMMGILKSRISLDFESADDAEILQKAQTPAAMDDFLKFAASLDPDKKGQN